MPLSRLSARLSHPQDIISVAYFRIVFGTIAFAWTVFVLSNGRFAHYYVDPQFHFTYYGFDWVRPLPESAMYFLIYGLSAAAAMIALGLWYRMAIVFFAIAFTYLFLLERTNYQNHYYLITLMSWLMCVIPAHHAFSLDVLRRPDLRSDVIPGWCLFLIRFQVGVAYFFGGIAKIDSDWLRGMPVAIYLAKFISLPIIGQVFTQKWCWLLFAYGGMFLDLLAVPGLMFKRTRIYAVCAILFFHFTNSFLFTIDVFPYFMALSTPVFFESDWIRRKMKLPSIVEPSPFRLSNYAVVPLIIYVSLQLLIPLRQFVYPGAVGWHEYGHYFSWRMLARFKDGMTMIFAENPLSGKRVQVELSKFLTDQQISRMSRRPDMIHDFAQYLSNRLGEPGKKPRIQAAAYLSYNGRKHQLLIDPRVDLGDQPKSLGFPKWILPIQNPFPNEEQIHKIQRWYQSVYKGDNAESFAPMPWSESNDKRWN